MGQVCCNIRNVEKKTIDVEQLENNYSNEEQNNQTSKNLYEDSNAILICNNKSNIEINYNIKYKPRPKNSN